MKKYFWTIVLMLGVNASVCAANWKFVSTNSNGSSFFVDTDSIRRSGRVYDAWVKTELLQRMSNGALSIKAHHSFHCGRREMVTRHLIMWDGENHTGNIIVSGNPSDSWAPVSPDSVHEALWKFVCK